MKIAVIGSGISGMASAYYLSKQHEVHLFESSDRLGGHTNTIDLTLNSKAYSIDTGFIVFNSKNYPLFTSLMNTIGVDYQDSVMSFSVKAEQNGLEYNGTSINSLFCQRKNFFNPKFYRMVKDIMRFNKQASSYYQDQIKHNKNELMSIEDFARKNQYSDEFIEYYLIPMGAALWSASRGEMRKFPLDFFVRFFQHHGMLSIDDRPQWYVIKGGSKSYIPKLTAPYEKNIHLNSPVTNVKRNATNIEVSVNSEKLHFDQVVFATHADQTLEMMEGPTSSEREILGAFSYRPNDVLLHTDTSILPKSKLGWASWNYYVPKVERERVAVTYNMNILQNIHSTETFLVSLNMDDLIDPKKVLKKVHYSHPIFDLNASNAQKRWHEISGQDRIHFTGAYWGNGFHEDGTRSAHQVAQLLGAT
jgi:predicted NAD/FAD-binding protein